jgi:ketosteroid isomerase-like protein
MNALLQAYFAAFAGRDDRAIAEFLADDVVLQDPIVGIVRGKAAVLEVMRHIFRCHSLRLDIRRHVPGGLFHMVEFRLEITDDRGESQVVEGVDLIEVADGKIQSLRAYLDTRGG